MKKLIKAIFVLAAFISFCSFSKPSTPNAIKQGRIASFGNMPFSFAGLITDDEETFTLYAWTEEEIPSIPKGYTQINTDFDFSSISDKKIEFLGKITKTEKGFNQLQNGNFYVFAYKIIE